MCATSYPQTWWHKIIISYAPSDPTVQTGHSGSCLSLLQCLRLQMEDSEVGSWNTQRLGAGIIWRFIHPYVGWLMLADTFAGPAGWIIYTRPPRGTIFFMAWWLDPSVGVPQHRKSGRSCITCYGLALEVIQCHSHHILFIRREFLRLSHTQGKRT